MGIGNHVSLHRINPSAGNGILKVVALIDVDIGTVQRVKGEMVATVVEPAWPSLRPLRKITGQTGSGWPSES
jgi:hypothetical protein